MDPRPRRYLPRLILALSRPFFRYSQTRDAYVLRFGGNRSGPVLRPDRRTRQQPFDGPDRRNGPRGSLIQQSF
jgi:hypothetical protein